MKKEKSKGNLIFFLLAGIGILIAAGIAVKIGRIMMGKGIVKRKIRPNILIITLDTCRKDRLGIYGYSRDTSPVITSLAKDGVVFDNAFTVATNSAPSHATMFTGLYPMQHGLVDNGLKMDDEVVTLAEYFSSHHYETAAFIGYYALGKESGLDQGFKTFKRYDVKSHQHDKKSLERDMRGFEAARSWIKKWYKTADSKRFFLWLHAQQIHESYDPPPPYDSLYRRNPPRSYQVKGFKNFDIRCANDISKVWRSGLLTKEMQEDIAALYDGEIRLVDDYIGKIIQDLRSMGLYKNTLIVLIADHGEMFFEYPEGDFGRVNLGHTGRYFDPSLRIPFIMKLPEDMPVKGVRVQQFVSSIDLAPTIIDIIGHKQLPWFAGRSLVFLLNNPETRTDEEKIFFQEIPFKEECVGVRTKYWKFIRKTKEGKKDILLMNFEKDPQEYRNMSKDFPDKAREMENFIDDWVASQKKKDHSSYEDMSKKMIEELRKAGYIR